MNSTLHEVDQLVIVGTGLLGASMGLALKADGFAGRIVGVGRRAATLDRARQIGAIDRGETALESTLADAQLVVLAVPLSGFAPMLERIGPHQHERLVVTDVGSTKSSVLAAAREHLPRPGLFVGAHPMAGSEQQGPAAACAELFAGKPCVLTPADETQPHALALVEALWGRLGMRLLHMSAAEHDQATAVISHLPHAVAALLVQVALERGGWDVASTGFRDTTRLASSNPPMRADIMAHNRGALLEALGAMRDQIDRLCDLIGRDDHAAVLALLEKSREARAAWIERASKGAD